LGVAFNVPVSQEKPVGTPDPRNISRREVVFRTASRIAPPPRSGLKACGAATLLYGRTDTQRRQYWGAGV